MTNFALILNGDRYVKALCKNLTITLSLLILPITLNAQGKMSEQEHMAILTFLQNSFNEDSSFKDKYDAEVWLFTQSNKLKRYMKNPQERLELLKAIHREATIMELNPDIVLALIQIESAFNRYAISRVGAQGLMQVMPFWKKEIGRDDDNLTDILTNLKYGCRILKYYINKEEGKGGLSMALARYNGSYPRTVYTEKVMNAWQNRWKSGFN
jgi:soluble lytic murein transglycosylase-like protein